MNIYAVSLQKKIFGKVRAESKMERWIDDIYDEKTMEKSYPNAISTK